MLDPERRTAGKAETAAKRSRRQGAANPQAAGSGGEAQAQSRQQWQQNERNPELNGSRQ